MMHPEKPIGLMRMENRLWKATESRHFLRNWKKYGQERPKQKSVRMCLPNLKRFMIRLPIPIPCILMSRGRIGFASGIRRRWKETLQLPNTQDSMPLLTIRFPQRRQGHIWKKYSLLTQGREK